MIFPSGVMIVFLLLTIYLFFSKEGPGNGHAEDSERLQAL